MTESPQPFSVELELTHLPDDQREVIDEIGVALEAYGAEDRFAESSPAAAHLDELIARLHRMNSEVAEMIHEATAGIAVMA